MIKESTEIVRMHCLIEGRVQGVCFRDYTRREALLLGVRGWVRNVPDGRVEAVFEGEPRAIQHLLSWAREGPPTALVTHIQVKDEEPRGEQGFAIRP